LLWCLIFRRRVPIKLFRRHWAIIENGGNFNAVQILAFNSGSHQSYVDGHWHWIAEKVQPGTRSDQFKLQFLSYVANTIVTPTWESESPETFQSDMFLHGFHLSIPIADARRWDEWKLMD
jgi:hypothetical protein